MTAIKRKAHCGVGSSFLLPVYKNAFKSKCYLKVLNPQLDTARYNVIQWVHRATLRFAYGSPSLLDPNAQVEIILKGHVTFRFRAGKTSFLIATWVMTRFLLRKWKGCRESQYRIAPPPTPTS